MKKLMMFCLCMYGCADYSIHNGKGYDKEFNLYVTEYVEQASLHNKPVDQSNLLDLTIAIGDLSKLTTEQKKTVVGLCQVKSGERIITLEKQYWPYANEYDRMSIMLHELGHCLSGFKHRDKDSIMNPTAIDGQKLNNNYSYYINELFN